MTLMQQLIMWQQERARKDHLEPYMVLQFNTIKEIVRLQPKTSTDLLRIKGIGPVKVRKYGNELLQIVRGDAIVRETKPVMQYEDGGDLFVEARMVNEIAAETYQPQKKTETAMTVDQETGEVIDDGNDTVTVTEFVSMLDTMLRTHFRSVRVQGEVVGFKRNASGHAYFEIKDKESVLRCMVFSSRYEIAGVTLTDGMEIVVTGYPNYHKQYGFGFVGTMVELFGEGALKKAYDDLKKKLDMEGLLAVEKKRAIPHLPQRIGLITSRTGAAIGDFMMNIGSYGYTIVFHQSRVEGAQAADDLIGALTEMAQQNIDVLVIVRGGGSLESLQAFNNERVVRMIAEFPVPVVAGVGHEQDETLSTLVADHGVSTPTAAARVVRESWDQCGEYIRDKEQFIMHAYDKMLRAQYENIAENEKYFKDQLEKIVAHAHELFHRFTISVQRIEKGIYGRRALLITRQQQMVHIYKDMINTVYAMIDVSRIISIFQKGVSQRVQHIRFLEKTIMQYDPQRQLILGYSIVRDQNGKIIRKKNEVQAGDRMDIQVSDGVISADVK